MVRTMIVALSITLLAGCGTTVAPPTQAQAFAAQALAKADPFAKLHNLQVKDGGPSYAYPETKRHVAAKTAKNGVIWVNDNGETVKVLHNTQTVTNEKKLLTVATAMREAAAGLPIEDRKYVIMLASRVARSIPGVR